MLGATQLGQSLFVSLSALNMASALGLRSAIFLVAAALCVAAIQSVQAAEPLAANPKNQTIQIGKINYGDRQLHVETIRKSAKFLQIRKVDVAYPLAGSAPSATISCVQLVDLQQDGHNGAATLQKGGPGNKDVTVRFKSERGSGLYWNLYIWGK